MLRGRILDPNIYIYALWVTIGEGVRMHTAWEWGRGKDILIGYRVECKGT